MFAIRQIVHTPYEIVFGRCVTRPLDLLYSGWSDDMYKEMEVSEWVEKLKDRLAVIADMSFVNESSVGEKRALVFNRNKSERTLKVGDMVLLRTPGIQAALQAAWEGPFVVDQVISRVTYKVRRVEGDSVRLSI